MHKNLLILLILLAIFTSAFSQNPFVKNYTVANGLPTNKAYAVFMDSKGFMWFGTDYGVIKFDGSNFRHFDEKNGLENGVIIFIKEDIEGRIWLINLQGGVNYIKDNVVYNQLNAPFLAEIRTNFHFHNFLQDKDSTLYFYNANAEIYVVKNNEYIDYLNFRRIAPNEKGTMFQMSKTTGDNLLLWFSNAFYSFKEIDGEFTKIEHNYDFLKTLPENEPNNYGVNGNGKITHFKNDSIVYSFFKKGPSLKVNSVLLDNDGYYWVAVFDEGLFCFKDGVLMKKLDIKKITNLVLDNDNNIWTVSNTSGIYKINRSILKYSFIGKENFDGIGIAGMQNDLNSGFWLTNGKSIFYSNRKNTFFAIPIKAENDNLTEIIQPYPGTLLLSGVSTPLYKIDNFKTNHQGKILSINNTEMSNLIVKDLTYNPTNNFLYSTRDDKIFFSNADSLRFRAFSPNKGRITHVFVNNKGNLVVNAAINFKIENRIAHYQSEYSELNGKLFIGNLSIDSNNELIVTLGNEIFLHQNDKFYNLTKNTKEQFDFRIRGIEYDGKTVYVYTIKSIYFFDDDFIRFKDGNLIAQKIDLEFNNVNDIIYHDNLIYVASDDGLLYFPANEITQKKYTAPKCYFNQVMVNDREIDFTTNQIIYKSNQRLSIDFSSLNFSSFLSEYAYQLSGVDPDWLKGKENRVVYVNIPPGEYEFRVKARISNYDYGEIITLPINVLPTFFQRLEVKIFGLFLFTALLFLIFWLSYRRKLNKEITESTLINLEHKALQSMMNPHFIFNALGSIQRYLLENKSVEASSYLSKFARLIRQNMNSLQTNSIDINEEVERLRNYIELERFRMNNSFDYSIEIDEQIDDVGIKIPAMIIQPFVENAIWHGVSSLVEDGMIKIMFKPQSDNSLEIRIEDNGVGVEFAQSFANNKDGLKVGASITQKRIQLLGKKLNVQTHISVNKIYPGEKLAGTRVTIICPILN